MIQGGINPAALSRKATDLETKLNKLEDLKDELVALGDEEEGRQWEERMHVDARPKISAAL